MILKTIMLFVSIIITIVIIFSGTLSYILFLVYFEKKIK